MYQKLMLVHIPEIFLTRFNKKQYKNSHVYINSITRLSVPNVYIL